jgi:hypothetical protein
MSIDLKVWLVRVALWLLSILIVGAPLEIARRHTGDAIYLLASAAVLFLCHFLGRVIANRMLNRAKKG